MKSLGHGTNEAEFSLRHLLAFIYLWPFFLVWSFNAPTWWGVVDRNGFNRFNGILVLCALDVIAVLTFLPQKSLHALTEAGAIGIFLVLLAAHYVWLDGPRGEHLKLRFRSVSAMTKLTVRSISAVLFGGIIIWFFVTIPASKTQPTLSKSIACGDAAEVTAACAIEGQH